MDVSIYRLIRLQRLSSRTIADNNVLRFLQASYDQKGVDCRFILGSSSPLSNHVFFGSSYPKFSVRWPLNDPTAPLDLRPSFYRSRDTSHLFQFQNLRGVLFDPTSAIVDPSAEGPRHPSFHMERAGCLVPYVAHLLALQIAADFIIVLGQFCLCFTLDSFSGRTGRTSSRRCFHACAGPTSRNSRRQKAPGRSLLMTSRAPRRRKRYADRPYLREKT